MKSGSLAGRGVLPRLRSTPPLPPLLGGARQGGRGVPGGKDRRGERKGDGRMRSDRDERGEREKKKISVRFPDTLPLSPQPAERFTRGAMRWYWTSLVDGPMLLRLLADGGGSSGRGQPAASPPFPAPPQTWRMAAGFGSSTVERVSSTIFMGVHIKEDLTWTTNTTSLSKKAQQCLYFLRRLKSASLPPPILTTFYRGTITILRPAINIYSSSLLWDKGEKK